MKKLFITLVLLAFTATANATTTLYQAVGVIQYHQQNQPMRAQTFDVGNFLSLAACNAAIANHNDLLVAGSVTPGNQHNSRTKLDAICHAVIPPQLPGYYAIGLAQVQQSNQASQPLQFQLGPFGTLASCNAALNNQKTLTLQNTPIGDINVAYKLDGLCHKLMD